MKFNTYIEYMNKIYTDSLFETAVDNFIVDAKMAKRIFFIGNGGSASLASHFAQDINKATQPSLKIFSIQRTTAISLCDNTAFITALANDDGYETIFTQQLEAHNFDPSHDLLFAISCSGNSKNVVNAIKYIPYELRQCVYIMTAFNGGEICTLVSPHHHMHIHTNDIYTAESLHSVLHHYIIIRLIEGYND